MVEIGESVLSFGTKPTSRRGGAATSNSAAATTTTAGSSSNNNNNKGKRKASSSDSTTASQQRLLSDLPVDEEGNATGRRKIQIEYIQDRSRRHITFSKRKAGIMKKVRPHTHTYTYTAWPVRSRFGGVLCVPEPSYAFPTGLRAFNVDWHPSASLGRLRSWNCLQ